MATKNMKKIVACVERGEGANKQSHWKGSIGVAFENQDGSWNLLFDFFPTDPNTTIQLRNLDPKSDD